MFIWDRKRYWELKKEEKNGKGGKDISSHEHKVLIQFLFYKYKTLISKTYVISSNGSFASMSCPPIVVGFIYQDYRYKAAAAQISHNARLAPASPSGDRTLDYCVWGSDSATEPQRHIKWSKISSHRWMNSTQHTEPRSQGAGNYYYYYYYYYNMHWYL